MTRNELTENSAWKNPVKEKLLKGENLYDPAELAKERAAAKAGEKPQE